MFVSLHRQTAILVEAHTGHSRSLRLWLVAPTVVLMSFAPVLAQSVTLPCEVQKLLASDGVPSDYFGLTVAVSGNTAVIGAYLDDNPGGFNSGAAYVFTLSGSQWIEEAKLTASDAAAEDEFGRAVAIFGDTVVIGAYKDDNSNGIDAGAGYVFVRSGPSWVQQAKLSASDGANLDYFGYSVAVSADRVVIGSVWNDNAGGGDAGAAYVFVRTGSNWSELTKLLASDGAGNDQFGFSIAIQNSTLIISADQDDHSGLESAGAAYVFVEEGGSWIEQAKLIASDAEAGDYFGISVAVSDDTALIGAFLAESSGGENVGAGYVFVRRDATWAQQAKLTSSEGGEQLYGHAVSISGDLVLIGAPSGPSPLGTNAGVAYAYVRNSESWTEHFKLTASDGAAGAHFGLAVGLSGDLAFVGAYGTDSNTGAVYHYSLPPSLRPDCNGNGIADWCDILLGTSSDSNGNNIPDECQLCSADIDENGSVGVTDLLLLINLWGSCEGPGHICAFADIVPPGGGDGVVGVPDLLAVINGWGPCP